MSKRTGMRFGALVFLVAGIAIGYVAAKGGFTGGRVVEAQITSASDQQDQLAQSPTPVLASTALGANAGAP